MPYESGGVEGFYSKDNVRLGGKIISNVLFGEALKMEGEDFYI